MTRVAIGGHERSQPCEILGLNVWPLTMARTVEFCAAAVEQRRSLLIGVVNVAKAVKCRSDAALRRSLDEADLVVADGLPIVWLSRLMGRPLPERVTGIDLMMELLQLSSSRGYRVFFLGATQQVVERVAERSALRFPGMIVAGLRNGYFLESDEPEVAAEIRDSGADIIFVAMTSPKKENFLRCWRDTMGVPVCHGVGGSFDVLAGITRRAPAWMQRTGLEWLYRVLQEPRRMWKRYLVTNSTFLLLAVSAVWKARLRT